MTLNIILGNFVVADSEVSYFGHRTSDHIEKLEIFSAKNYHGVITGTGSAASLLKVFDFARNCEDYTDLETFVEGVNAYLNEESDSDFMTRIDTLERDLKRQYKLIENEEDKSKQIAAAFIEEFDGLRKKQKELQPTNMHFVGYDTTGKKLCKYSLTDSKDTPFEQRHLDEVVTDGSGRDLADAYLSTQTSGINWKEISDHQKLYLAALASAAATANAGVGGFMKIVKVEQDGATYIDEKIVNSSVRICSKQIAGKISKQEAMEFVKQVSNKKADYEKIAQSLDMTQNDLLYSPSVVNQDVSKFNKLYSVNGK